MEDWITLIRVFNNENEAARAAEILKITESRLVNVPRGPQFDIEAEAIQTENGWQVRWRKVFAGYSGGCSGCSTCSTDSKQSNPKKGKVLEFKPRKA